MNPTKRVRVILALVSAMALVTANQGAAADAHTEKLKALFDVRQPAGSGPFPAVVLVSGCSGFDAKLAKGAYDRVNAKLVERGFVTIRVDYVGARGATNCQSPTPIAKDLVAVDIMVGVRHLHTLPFVDTKKINLLGWSYGGGSIMAALAGKSSAAAAIVYYPHCPGVAPWNEKTPMLILAGAKDNVAPYRQCEGIVQRAPEPAVVKVISYEGAHHAFDVEELPAETQYQWGTLGYHPEAAAKSWEEVERFLRR